MKTLIVGASGRTGRELVLQAARRGHEVTAFVRTPKAFSSTASVALVQGDILDAASVERAVDGQDAVVCALGPRDRNDASLQSEGTRNLVSAMRAKGVRRLILMSSIGVGEAKKQSWFFGTLIVPLLLRKVFADKERQEEIVVDSRLDWTIVRPSHLTLAPPIAEVKVTTDYLTKVGWSIPRANVATFILDALETRGFVGMKPTIGSAR
jgi:putative NADH-flavin reductase